MLWLWLLLLHISAVICWCSSLLYLTGLIAGTAYRQTIIAQQGCLALASSVFRLFATPAALIAIVSGTALFMTRGINELWLVLKFTLVAFLVLCHTLSGWIILHSQEAPYKSRTLPCVMVGVVVILLIPAIIWTVLTKPF